jgi:hypothetical protein
MRVVTWVLIAAALAFGLGCASSDWIDRTLVTVDVTGTWQRSGSNTFQLELKQQGPSVTGYIQWPGASQLSGPIEGSVAGDVFRFRRTNGGVEGEMTVSGDEMDGRVSFYTGSSPPVSLRRVNSSPR